MARKIPPHAQQVFQGAIFSVWQWQQPMYDGSTETFEMLRRPHTAQVIAVVGDKIVILTQEQPGRSKPFTSLPGGRCDKDEDSLAAAKRELHEETGYASEDWILWKEVRPVGKIDWTIYTYVARNCTKAAEPKLDAGEKITPRLISFDQFLSLPDDPTFHDPELTNTLLRASIDAKKREELRALLFA